MEVLLDSDDPGDFASRLETLRHRPGNATTLTDLDSARRLQLNVELAGLKRLPGDKRPREAQAEAQKEVGRARQRCRPSADAARAGSGRTGRWSGVGAARRPEAPAVSAQAVQAVEGRSRDRIAAVARARGGGRPSVEPVECRRDIGPSGLAWPVTGAFLVQNDRTRIHPVCGYRSCRTGTDIQRRARGPDRAAADGVVSVDRSRTVGPCMDHTVIQHGIRRVHHVRPPGGYLGIGGDKVKAVRVIPGRSDHRMGDRPHLHFEVHRHPPHNPMGWFGGTKAPFCR